LTGPFQWGNAAEWVGGSATALAVVFAAVSVRQASRSARDAQSDRAYDEARKVEVQYQGQTVVDGGSKFRVTTTVTNHGSRPIADVRAFYRQRDLEKVTGASRFDFTPPDRFVWQFDLTPSMWQNVVREHGKPIVEFLDSNQRQWMVADGVYGEVPPARRWWHRFKR